MDKEEITALIKSLNEKRMKALKSSNYIYENQLKELVVKLKGDLNCLKSSD